MLSIEALKRIDKSVTEHLTDEELLAIRDSFYQFGELMFEDWREQKFDFKNPVRSLTNEQEEDTI